MDVDLAGTWSLQRAAGDISLPMRVPGDVHGTLLAAGRIPDPYFAANEAAVQWVANSDWVMQREFVLDVAPGDGFWTLTLDGVDCVAELSLNGHALGTLRNQFRRHRLEVGALLRQGANVLRLDFPDAFALSQALWEAQPFELPFARMGYRRTAINMLRKTQCAAGWDWNICLMPIGLYGEATLRRHRLARIEHVEATQRHDGGTVWVTVTTELHGYAAGTLDVTTRFDGDSRHRTVSVAPGVNTVVETFDVAAPRLWWPAGQGEQPLYELTVQAEGDTVQRRIGLRVIELVTEPDDIGRTMKFRVNGRDVFAKGANWIPADAMPGRITPEVVLPQLQAATAVHMNMLRVWGGGRFEPDWFYDACDRLGLMIWHDFMFACMHYPSDRGFLAEVRAEATYQVRRLSHHACLALWCGDNEIIGAMTWYDCTRNDRDRYIVNYDRLNRTLGEVVEDHDPQRTFWPSSPSLGILDFADGWHNDTRGDLHFWEVWHSAKPFEFYRTVQPRFCSEFGFQSFPSMRLIRSFVDEADLNLSSPAMEVHQRNQGGNARMAETMTRYFRFPRDFANLVYLSQVQQGLAMRTAIEYWRSLKPRCMGTLYWQLNDSWPVASWSSIEYGGGWKALQYMARRFYAPVIVVAVPMEGAVRLVAVSDVAGALALHVSVRAVAMSGATRALGAHTVTVTDSAAVDVTTLAAETLAGDEFLMFAWHDGAGEHAGENEFFPRFYKEYDLPVAAPTWHVEADAAGSVLVLESDRPAFFVTLTHERAGVWSDNCFTLLPGSPRRLRWTPADGGAALSPADAVTVQHLQESY